MKHPIRAMLVGLVSVTCMAFGIAPAQAKGDDGLLNRDQAIKMAKARAAKIVDLGDVKIIDARSTSAVAAARTSCVGEGFAPWGVWGLTVKAPCAVFGHNGYRRTYNWWVPWWSGANVCVQAQGFNSGKTATYYGLGCGDEGWGNVPWGNVLAQPAARGQAYQSLGRFQFN